jgi:hypothetical protein
MTAEEEEILFNQMQKQEDKDNGIDEKIYKANNPTS